MWCETLKDYSYQELVAAMTDLIINPPKYQLEDGTIQVWRGMPKLPDVVGVMVNHRERNAAALKRQQSEQELKERLELHKRQKEHPEEFMSLQEFMEEFGKTHGWPQPHKEQTEAEYQARVEFLRKQASEISDKSK